MSHQWGNHLLAAGGYPQQLQQLAPSAVQQQGQFYNAPLYSHAANELPGAASYPTYAAGLIGAGGSMPLAQAVQQGPAVVYYLTDSLPAGHVPPQPNTPGAIAAGQVEQQFAGQQQQFAQQQQAFYGQPQQQQQQFAQQQQQAQQQQGVINWQR